MTLSTTVFECQDKIANTLQTQFEGKVDPCLLENIIVGVCMEVARAHQLGWREGLAALQKERSDRAWEEAGRNGQQGGT